MRYFFLFLVITFLVYGCGRDAASVGDTAAAPALAPASAPAIPAAPPNKYQDVTLESEPRLGDAGRDEMAPPASSSSPVVTRAEANSLSHINRKSKQQPTPSASNTNQQVAPSGVALPTTNQPSVVDLAKIEAETVFSVSTTPCYGTCKQYSVTLYNNGLVVYKAIKDVKREGVYALMLKDFPETALMGYFRDATAAGLRTIYPVDEVVPADIPSTVLRYPGVNGQQQVVRVYSDAPEQLQRLFDLVEEMTEQQDWQEVKG